MKLSSFFVATVLAQVEDECYSGQLRVDCNTFQPFPEEIASGFQARGRKKGNRENKGKKRENNTPIPSRYGDLATIAKKVWQSHGLKKKEGFDERKFWAYGCHCHLLSDKPMSEMGKGPPVDELDNKCILYKSCLGCLESEFGTECNNNDQTYKWVYKRKTGEVYSKEDMGTCRRALFECDKKFALDMFAEKETYTESHGLFSGFDSNLDENCGPHPSRAASVGGGGGGGVVPSEQVCCGGSGFPYHYISLSNHKCCNGQVKNTEESC